METHEEMTRMETHKEMARMEPYSERATATQADRTSDQIARAVVDLVREVTRPARIEVEQDDRDEQVRNGLDALYAQAWDDVRTGKAYR